MSKLSNCLEMLVLLKSRGQMQVHELAQELEVRERQIREYKYEIEKTSIRLDSKQGRYGGYSIGENSFIPCLDLNKGEYSSLLTAKEFLKKENNFMLLKEYERALDKINVAVKEKEKKEPMEYILSDSKPNINLEKEKKKYLDISRAITSRRRLKINYFAIESGLQKRVIRPYALFLYKGFWYCIGYCELRNKIRDFKLSRMKEYEILEEEFERPSDFNIKNHVGNSSIYNNEEYDIKLKIDMPMAILVSERIWAENQKITSDKEDSILFEAKMGLTPELNTWILSMGSCVEVLEPKKLREGIKKEIEKLSDLYKF